MGGQRSRAGGTVPLWFEWGQTPLHMRLPKARWFKRYFKLLKDVAPINLETLETIDVASPITHQSLSDAGLIKTPAQQVKILWKTVSKKLAFEGITLFSKWAREAVEKAWGSIA
jgi:large subunit ribosomal protein L15